jgi:hypothetical protein
MSRVTTRAADLLRHIRQPAARELPERKTGAKDSASGTAFNVFRIRTPGEKQQLAARE